MKIFLCSYAAVSFWIGLSTSLLADDFAKLQESFGPQVESMLNTHCIACHDSETKEAQLDLSTIRSEAEVAAAPQIWQLILQRVEAGEMPPADVDVQPTEQQRAEFSQWIRKFLDSEAERTAGDPGGWVGSPL